MKNLFSYTFISIIIITIIISILSTGLIENNQNYEISTEDIYVNSRGFTWPIIGKSYISSYFGYRDLKLNGSGPFHSGIDIPAEEGTYLLSSYPGTVTYAAFSGSGRLYNNHRKL